MSTAAASTSTTPRYVGDDVHPSEGWSAVRVAGPSQLVGANGIAVGPDGRLHVAQLYGSCVSAIDLTTREVQAVWPASVDGLVGPDDIAFDTRGVMYVADMSLGVVRALTPEGVTSVIAEDLPSVNGIMCHGDRVFVDECRHGGRLLEVFLDGRPPKVLVDDLDTPNALQAGSDGYLYYPLVLPGEVWRVPIDGGQAEHVAGDLAFPLSCRFNPSSGRLTVVESGNGRITELDLSTGDRSTVVQTRPGSDNIAFSPDGRLFVSFINGAVTEIENGQEVPLVAAGCIWPLGLAASSDGTYVADLLQLWRVGDAGLAPAAGMFDADGESFPGFISGIAAAPQGGFLVTNTAGELALYEPNDHRSSLIASDLLGPLGVSASQDGTIVVAERGRGCVSRITPDGDRTVVADGLAGPVGVAAGADGTVYVSESLRGVVRAVGGGSDFVAPGFDTPHGLAVLGDDLFVVDAGARTLSRLGLADGQRELLAENLPLGARAGAPHPGHDFVPGLLVSFCGVAVGDDGVVSVACDRDGSIWQFHKG